MRRALVILATLVVLWVLVAQVNHYLAPLRVHVYVGGLFIAYAALMLPLRGGAWVMMVAGLLCDASTPATFGTQMMMFVLGFLAINTIRDRLPKEEMLVRLTVALLANLGLMLAISFVHLGDAPSAVVAWGRIVCDLLLSQLIIAILGPWFFALQSRALQISRERLALFD